MKTLLVLYRVRTFKSEVFDMRMSRTAALWVCGILSVTAWTAKADDAKPATPVNPSGIFSVEDVSKTPVSVSVRDVDMYGLMRAVAAATTKGKTIEIRMAQPIEVTFSTKNAPFGKLLEAGATMAGCELYLLPDRFLVSPPNLLTDEERKIGEPYRATQAERNAIRANAFSSAVVHNLLQLKNEQVTFAELNPSTRQMLSWMMDEQSAKTNTSNAELAGDAQVTLAKASNGNYNLALKSALARRTYFWLNVDPN